MHTRPPFSCMRMSSSWLDSERPWRAKLKGPDLLRELLTKMTSIWALVQSNGFSTLSIFPLHNLAYHPPQWLAPEAIPLPPAPCPHQQDPITSDDEGWQQVRGKRKGREQNLLGTADPRLEPQHQQQSASRPSAVPMQRPQITITREKRARLVTGPIRSYLAAALSGQEQAETSGQGQQLAPPRTRAQTQNQIPKRKRCAATGTGTAQIPEMFRSKQPPQPLADPERTSDTERPLPTPPAPEGETVSLILNPKGLGTGCHLEAVSEMVRDIAPHIFVLPESKTSRRMHTSSIKPELRRAFPGFNLHMSSKEPTKDEQRPTHHQAGVMVGIRSDLAGAMKRQNIPGALQGHLVHLTITPPGRKATHLLGVYIPPDQAAVRDECIHTSALGQPKQGRASTASLLSVTGMPHSGRAIDRVGR